MDDSSPPLPSVQPPPGLPPYVQTVENRDTEHLKILSICYYVMSGLSLFAALFFALYIVMGGFLVSGSFVSGAHTPSHVASEMQMMGGFFLVFGIIGSLWIVAMAVAEFFVARNIVRRRTQTLCYIVAGLNCLNMPLGTVLGVFTFIVMTRPSVTASFARNKSS